MSIIEHMKLVPWGIIRKGLRTYRRAFPREWSDDIPTIVLDETHEAVESRLRDRGYEGTPYTLYYEGEVVNLRLPIGINADGVARERHVRTRDHDDGIEVCAHEEASRYEEKERHLTEPVDWLGEDRLRTLYGKS